MNFDETTFLGTCHFQEVRLGGTARWRAAEFRDFSNFTNLEWGVDAKGSATLTHYGGAFEAARFRDVADFQTDKRGLEFSAFAAFDNATFEKALILSDPTEQKSTKDRFKAACLSAECAIAEDRDAALKDEKDTRSKREVKRDAANKRWTELSGGYRTVKNAMEAQGDFDRAQRYYRYEVQARLKRPKTSWPEKLAAGFYALFSDYGASIARPFIGIAFFVLCFAAIYLAMGVSLGVAEFGANTPLTDMWQALEFSLNNAFRPLSALATQPPTDGQIERLTGKLLFDPKVGGGWGNLVRVFAIIQSLFSFVLAFLFALAVRRKFQINN